MRGNLLYGIRVILHKNTETGYRHIYHVRGMITEKHILILILSNTQRNCFLQKYKKSIKKSCLYKNIVYTHYSLHFNHIFMDYYFTLPYVQWTPLDTIFFIVYSVAIIAILRATVPLWGKPVAFILYWFVVIFSVVCVFFEWLAKKIKEQVY